MLNEVGKNGKIGKSGGRYIMNPILGVGIYFCATVILSYYFVGVSFIKALQMAFLITMLHVLILFVDKLYKRKQRR